MVAYIVAGANRECDWVGQQKTSKNPGAVLGC
jgi:hypothetical protein